MPLPRSSIPRMALVRQVLPMEHVGDVEEAIRQRLRDSGLLARLRPGARIALTAGSRGIASIDRIIRTIGQEVKAAGGQPFVVPAMGSHGGATADGQARVLAGFGITEENVGMPVRSSMEVVELGRTSTGAAVFMDRLAYEADGVVVVGRVKPHTAFRGEIESGLCKMLVVGLGKQRGAESLHAHGIGESLAEAASISLQHGKVVAGVAIVENAFHQVHTIRVVPPDRFHQTDRDLLTLCNRLLPRVPFDELDLLVVGWMGKDVSGSGMDYNVVGMWRRIGGDPVPNYRRIVVLDITDGSQGNGLGVGIADFTTRKLINKLDLDKTYTNAITANALMTVKLPIILPSAKDAIEVALASLGDSAGRVVCIHSTLHLEQMLVSESLLPSVEADPRLHVMGPPRELEFDAAGDLIWPW